MKRWVLIPAWVLMCTACGKSTVGTEIGNPPNISIELVSVSALEPGAVKVVGEPGAVSPGGGQIAISNGSATGQAVVTDVELDGSFEARLGGSLDEDYELVASNEHGSSPPQTTSPQAPIDGTIDVGPPSSSEPDPGADSTCQLIFDRGSCDDSLPVFWYDADTGRCEAATYGGCEGNDNRFGTLEACQALCVGRESQSCETDADCGWGEIPREILAPSDCLCLYGCPGYSLNTGTIERRQAQYDRHCQAARDGNGELCGIDDCTTPGPAACLEGRCTGDF